MKRWNRFLVMGVVGVASLTLLAPEGRADWRSRHGGGHRGGYRGGHHGDAGWIGFGIGVATGAFFASLPRERTRIVVAGSPYYYYDGVYYSSCPGGYTVVQAPMIAYLPPGAVPVMVRGSTYYYAGGTYYTAHPNGYVVVPPPAPAPVAAAPVPQAPVTPAPPSFYQLGHDWARDLRADVATLDQFVDYLEDHVIQASDADIKEFRSGFLSAYGVNGEAAFEKAFNRAKD